MQQSTKTSSSSVDGKYFQQRHFQLALGLVAAAALILGCARQYHWYRCGCDCVNYHYCPPAPLPYTPYCTCPTPVANSYQHQTSQPASEPIAPPTPSEPTTTEALPE